MLAADNWKVRKSKSMSMSMGMSNLVAQRCG